MKPVVAFDIDNTLLSYTNSPIKPVINVLKKRYNQGYKIILITARPNIKTVRDITQCQLSNIDILKYISNIYYTSGGNKVPWLRKYKVREFYDDRQYNMDDALKAIKKGELNPKIKLYKIDYV